LLARGDPNSSVIRAIEPAVARISPAKVRQAIEGTR
jgi:hypothetical protein